MPNLRLHRLFSCFHTKPTHQSSDESIETTPPSKRSTPRPPSSETASVPQKKAIPAKVPRHEALNFARHNPRISSLIKNQEREGQRNPGAVVVAAATNANPSPTTITSPPATIDPEDPDAITPADPLPLPAGAPTYPSIAGSAPMYINVKNALEDRKRLFERLRNPQAVSTEAVVGRSTYVREEESGRTSRLGYKAVLDPAKYERSAREEAVVARGEGAKGGKVEGLEGVEES